MIINLFIVLFISISLLIQTREQVNVPEGSRREYICLIASALLTLPCPVISKVPYSCLLDCDNYILLHYMNKQAASFLNTLSKRGCRHQGKTSYDTQAAYEFIVTRKILGLLSPEYIRIMNSVLFIYHTFKVKGRIFASYLLTLRRTNDCYASLVFGDSFTTRDYLSNHVKQIGQNTRSERSTMQKQTVLVYTVV